MFNAHLGIKKIFLVIDVGNAFCQGSPMPSIELLMAGAACSYFPGAFIATSLKQAGDSTGVGRLCVSFCRRRCALPGMGQASIDATILRLLIRKTFHLLNVSKRIY